MYVLLVVQENEQYRPLVYQYKCTIPVPKNINVGGNLIRYKQVKTHIIDSLLFFYNNGIHLALSSIFI